MGCPKMKFQKRCEFGTIFPQSCALSHITIRTLTVSLVTWVSMVTVTVVITVSCDSSVLLQSYSMYVCTTSALVPSYVLVCCTR